MKMMNYPEPAQTKQPPNKPSAGSPPKQKDYRHSYIQFKDGPEAAMYKPRYNTVHKRVPSAIFRISTVPYSQSRGET